jgi:hypothetical protein
VRRLRKHNCAPVEPDTIDTRLDLLEQPALLVRMNEPIGPLVTDLALLLPRATSLGLIQHRLARPVGDMAIDAAAELSDEDLITLMS